MPWKEADAMSLRREFVWLASQGDLSRRELCRRFGISPSTGYKWLRRFEREGEAGLRNRSRRPRSSPRSTPARVVQAVLRIREATGWGGRKIQWQLRQEEIRPVPSPSTITAILRREGRLDDEASGSSQRWKRFEAKGPNVLLQMDFKGPFTAGRDRCHTLTVLDDHSRFALAVEACADQRRETVEQKLRKVFTRYGLPDRLLVDNGSPWGGGARAPLTGLTVWLMRLGVRITHARPGHPQTLGKDERFHQTLDRELLRRQRMLSLVDCQHHFDPWRNFYNHQRPHEALGMEVPAHRYRSSTRSFPRELAPIEYPETLLVRKVHPCGRIWYRNRPFKLSKALRGFPVGLRIGPRGRRIDVYFSNQHIKTFLLDKSEQSPT